MFHFIKIENFEYIWVDNVCKKNHKINLKLKQNFFGLSHIYIIFEQLMSTDMQHESTLIYAKWRVNLKI